MSDNSIGKLIEMDVYRWYGEKKLNWIKRLFLPLELEYLICLRKTQKKGFMSFLYKIKLRLLSRITHIQITELTRIGEGFYIGHLGRIIINPRVSIGRNCNIATGVTIGAEYRGARMGAPEIGNQVWIGTNAVITGGVKIGDDVMIAPLTFVNFDVPSHSIVLGNPGRIIRKDFATEGYISNKV